MIKIVGVRKPEVSYTLIEGKTYDIGRKEGDISFPDDQSISRHHGQIFVDHPIANITNMALIPNVCVTDLGSKFGTFVNEGIEKKTALSVREKMNLSAGDRFKFGLQWNEFRIEYTPLVTTSSAVKDIQSLKTVICKLGAHLLPEWTDKCDFVIMESITLTIKAVCALLSAKRIVTPAYFKDLLECHITGKSSLPNPSNFLPGLAEKALKDHNVSFEPNDKRAHIFEGKIFMFVNTKHLRKLAIAVESGGGTTCLITSATTAELKSPKSLLMALVVDNSSLEKSTLEAIENYKKYGKRAIPESEIGLAALHCSTEKHCNPIYNFNKAVLPNPRMISQTQASRSSSNASFLPVPETQDMVTQRSVESYSIDVVEETMISTSSGNKTSSSSVDDISNDDDGNPGPSKKSLYSKKRQDDDVQELPTSKRRFPKEAETFLEPSIKKARKDPITSNKTLSSLFDSSSDEDEEPVKLEEKIEGSETMDVDQHSQDNIVDGQIEAAPSGNTELNDDVVPSTPATVDRIINPTPHPCNTQDDLFPTEVPDGPSVSAKRKHEEDLEDDAPKNIPKARKVTATSNKQVIIEKIKKLDISKKSGETKSENGNEASNDHVVYACPTVFVKQVLIEKQPSVDESNTYGGIVNYKRFKKVTALNSSCTANSLLEESASIRLVLEGEEISPLWSTFSKNTKMGNTNNINESGTNQDQGEIFEDRVSAPQLESEPSTSRRSTRSGIMSPPKPVSSRTSKPTSEKYVNESQLDFERHVEGGTRLTRSRSGNVPGSPSKSTRKKNQEEIQDMWTF